MGNCKREEVMNGLLVVLENLTHKTAKRHFFIQSIEYRYADPGFRIPAIHRKDKSPRMIRKF
jgi:hypothetical protein